MCASVHSGASAPLWMPCPKKAAMPSHALESVVTTAELSRRPARRPDHEAENGVLAALAQDMLQSPERILHNLAQAALSLCTAGSAGISLIEPDGKLFRWHALAGELAPHLGGTTPREFSPCGTVVDRNSIQLFSYPERHFRYFADVRPVIVEALLVPFSFERQPVGTIWVVTHDGQRRFDAEDARLIDKLGRFAAAAYQLRSALALAQETNRHKDEFLEVLSHELRNPLLPMQLVADLLADQPPNHDEVKRASGVMQRQLEHLAHLVGDLKDVASISRGKLELRKERVALAAVVAQAVEVSRPIIDAAGHALTVTLPPSPVFVEADPIRLVQVITNLLNNAAKFTARGGCLEVSAEAQHEDALIRVQDDGIGIEAGMLSRIFEPYAQIEPSDRTSDAGMGIGLTLARSLVELHGGTIVAHSSGLGRGSEFVVRLARCADLAQSALATSAAELPKPAAEQLRVLVVDDHPDTADALAWVLHKIGHEARAVYDGPSAIRAFEELSPDVILQDLLMPHTGGLEIAREIRRRSVSSRVFVVAITAAARAEALRDKCEDFDDLVVKPIGLRQLKDVLRKASLSKAVI